MLRDRTESGTIRRDQRGFTLPELLVATIIGLVVIGAGVAMFTAGIRNEPRVSSRASDVQEARVTMERITRELRQGWSAPAATASALTILVYVHKASCGGASATTSIPCRVTYSCSGGTCTRTEKNPNGSGNGAAVQVVSGLSSSNVFSYSPSSTAPTYVGVMLSFPAQDGDDAITLDGGAALRNPNS